MYKCIYTYLYSTHRSVCISIRFWDIFMISASTVHNCMSFTFKFVIEWGEAWVSDCNWHRYLVVFTDPGLLVRVCGQLVYQLWLWTLKVIIHHDGRLTRRHFGVCRAAIGVFQRVHVCITVHGCLLLYSLAILEYTAWSCGPVSGARCACTAPLFPGCCSSSLPSVEQTHKLSAISCINYHVHNM